MVIADKSRRKGYKRTAHTQIVYLEAVTFTARSVLMSHEDQLEQS